MDRHHTYKYSSLTPSALTKEEVTNLLNDLVTDEVKEELVVESKHSEFVSLMDKVIKDNTKK